MLINLTFLAVIEELDVFLSIQPDLSSLPFSREELRKRLLTYVLPRCQDRFKWVELNDVYPYFEHIPCSPLEQRLEIEALIKAGMNFIWKQVLQNVSHGENFLENSEQF